MIFTKHRIKYLGHPIFISLVISVLVIIISSNQVVKLIPINPEKTAIDDFKYYSLIAKGNFSEVIYPFSVRMLYPVLAGSLSRITGISLNWAFLLLSSLSLIGFLFSLSWYHKSISGNISAALFVLSPLLCFFYQTFYIPDLFYSFLLILFIISLKKRNIFLTSILLFLLFLTKETTIIVTIVTLLIYWIKKEKRSILIITAITIFSIIVNIIIQQHCKPNIHQLNNGLYLVLKIFYNFLYNIGGIRLWSNTFSLIPCEPVYFLNLEKYHIFGQIKSVGYCCFDIFRPFATLSILISVFGLLFANLIFFIKKNKVKKFIIDLPIEVFFSLIYGILLFLVGTSSGSWVYRLVGYGWPAFWIASIYFISSNIVSKRAYITLLILHLSFSWIPWFFGFYKYLQYPFMYLENRILFIIFFSVCILIIIIYLIYISRIFLSKHHLNSEINS